MNTRWFVGDSDGNLDEVKADDDKSEVDDEPYSWSLHDDLIDGPPPPNKSYFNSEPMTGQVTQLIIIYFVLTTTAIVILEACLFLNVISTR